MSMVLKRVYYCDVCGDMFRQDELSSVRIPMWSRVSDEDGAPKEAYISVEKADLCDECMVRHAVAERGFRCVKGYRPCPEDAKVYSHNTKTTMTCGGVEVEDEW